MGDLFEDHIETNANNQDHMPLAEKVRPCSMDKFFGQDHQQQPDLDRFVTSKSHIRVH